VQGVHVAFVTEQSPTGADGRPRKRIQCLFTKLASARAQVGMELHFPFSPDDAFRQVGDFVDFAGAARNRASGLGEREFLWETIPRMEPRVSCF
jgi:hypothetical protein